MFNDQLLYKEVKNYKNLENHWISGKIKDDNKIVLNKKYVLLEFLSGNKNKDAFRISHKLIDYNQLFDRNLISYDISSKQIIHKSVIDIWYNDANQINLGSPLQHKYLKKNFVERKYINNKNLFFNIEQKKNLVLLKNNKLKFFNYLNIWKKVYKFDYTKNILKLLLLKFIKKQNMLYIKKNLKKNNVYIKSIFLGFHKKGLIMYSPAFFKVFLIPSQFINKNINKLLKKKKKKHTDWLLIYSIFFTYNVYYKINIKYYKKFFL